MWESGCTLNRMGLGHSINRTRFTLDVLFSVEEIQTSTEGARDVLAGAARFRSARADLASAESVLVNLRRGP